MNKIVITLAVVGLFAFATPTFAATPSVICDNPDHPIWSLDNSSKIGCITDVSWQASLASQVNQLNKDDFVKVLQGQKLMTTFGEDGCPSWFPMTCVIKKSLFVNFL